MTDAARSRQPGTARSLLAALVAALQQPVYDHIGTMRFDWWTHVRNRQEDAEQFLSQPEQPIDVERLSAAVDYWWNFDEEDGVLRRTSHAWVVDLDPARVARVMLRFLDGEASPAAYHQEGRDE